MFLCQKRLSAFYNRYLPLVVLFSFLTSTICVIYYHLRIPAGVYVAILAFCVVPVTIWPPERTWAKAMWISIFAFIAAFEIYNLYQAQIEHDIQQGIITNNLKEVSSNLKESSATLAKVSNKLDASINTMTGEYSFGYISALFFSPNSWVPSFNHEGKYPLYDVHARIVDLEKLNNLAKNPSLAGVLSAETRIDIGDVTLSRSKLFLDKSIPIMSVPHLYNIFFTARNGSWHEQLEIKKTNDGKFIQTIKVYRKEGKKGVDKVILERTTEKASGKIWIPEIIGP